jgi:O-antigen/teichoic acid export membrane protein
MPALSATGASSAITGSLWIVLSNVLTRGVSLVGQIVLAWLLVPEDFGVWALALSISNALAALRNGGTSQILVKRGSEYATHVGPIFRFSLAFNALAMVILCGVAAFMSAGRPGVAPVLLGIALSIPLATPAMVLKAKLAITRRFRELGAIGLRSALLWQATTVALAFCGFGASSFAIAPLVQAGYESLASWRYTGRFPDVRAPTHAGEYWNLLRESRWIMLSSAALALATTGDYFAVALLSDTRTAGLYFFAFQLTAAIGLPLSGALETVLPPLLTQLNHDIARQTAACVRTIRVIMAAAIPVAAAFSLGAPLAIHLIWQGRWDEAAPLARILAICIPAWLFVSIARALIEARGLWRGRFIVLGLYGLGGMTAAAIGILWDGLHTIAPAVTAFYLAFAAALLLLFRMLGVPLKQSVAAILLPAAITGAGLVGGDVLATVLVHDAGSYVHATVTLAVFLAIVAAGNLVFMREVWREITSAVVQRLGRIPE